MNASTAVTRGLAFGYSPRGGVLQQARATVAVSWFLVLGLVVLLFQNPIMLVAALLAAFVMAARCAVLGEVAFAVAITAPLALLMTLVNPIASQQGLTVLIEGINIPVLGTIDVTQEALAYGLVLGLRATAIFALAALYVCTVDPDELLRVLRRYSVRSAIAASLAVRFVPVLARDGVRLVEARQCRPGKKPGAAALARGALARSLDRASDAALALETRGFALARPLRVERRPLSRADLTVAGSAIAVLLAALLGRGLGAAGFTVYPLTEMAAGRLDIAFAALLLAIACVPSVLPRRGDE